MTKAAERRGDSIQPAQGLSCPLRPHPDTVNPYQVQLAPHNQTARHQQHTQTGGKQRQYTAQHTTQQLWGGGRESARCCCCRRPVAPRHGCVCAFAWWKCLVFCSFLAWLFPSLEMFVEGGREGGRERGRERESTRVMVPVARRSRTSA